MRSILLALGLLVLLPTACRKPDAAASTPPQAPAVEAEPEPEPDEAPLPSLACQAETCPRLAVQPVKATVQGPSDADIIRRIVRARIPEVRDCYTEQLKVEPGLKGRVTVQFAIGPEGQIEAAALAGIDPEHEGLSAVGEWRSRGSSAGGSPSPGTAAAWS